MVQLVGTRFAPPHSHIAKLIDHQIDRHIHRLLLVPNWLRATRDSTKKAGTDKKIFFIFIGFVFKSLLFTLIWQVASVENKAVIN